MHIHQLMAGCLSAALLTGACNRQEADQNARRAADEMRVAAARAGDKLGDGWLTTKIQAQYFADDDIKARDVNVRTRDGVVTVSGRVDNDRAREQALQIARNTDGVRDVVDQLAVAQPSPAQVQPPAARPPALEQPTGTAGTIPVLFPRDDADVTALIQSKFFLDTALKTRAIEVYTRGGTVTLRGEVGGDTERAQALLLARTTSGVERVEDALTVNVVPPSPEVSAAAAADENVTRQVQERLAADAVVKAGSVQVTARDGVVLIEGTMPSTAAKQRALTLARETSGVVQVVDRITVRRR